MILISVGLEGSLQKLFEVFVFCVHGLFFVPSFQPQILNIPFLQNHQKKILLHLEQPWDLEQPEK